jgi:hypothetical protein
MGKHLTDDQLRIILEWADISTNELAAQLDKPNTTVWYARERLRSGKWVCAVRFEPCRRCGEPLTVRGSHNRHFYHTHCVKDALADYLKRRDAARPKDPNNLQQLYKRIAEIQQETRKTAVNLYKPWTVEEDAVVREMMNLPVAQTALRLGRTYSAVANRRGILRPSVAGEEVD